MEHAASASSVSREATTSRLPGEGRGATATAVEPPGLLPTTDGFSFDDSNIERMRKYIQDLELKNEELKQKLAAAEAKLKEEKKYMNSDPLIEAELVQCHDIFLCPAESNYKNLSSFLANPQNKLTMDVKVHGRRVVQKLKQFEKDLALYIPPGARAARAGKEKPKKLRRMTVLAKYIILGVIEDIFRLHRHGLALNGKFTQESFFWTHLKKIKLDPALKLVICKRNRDEMINDFHQIYQIILEMLSIHESGQSVPHDLQSLLNLLKSDDPVKHHQIIRYNMSLLSEIGKKAHFITLYDRLQQQIFEDAEKGPGEEKKSEIVMQYIATNFTYPGDGEELWSTMAKDNSYVGAVYDRRCQNTGKNILEEPSDLLIVWRNALCHILDNSVKDGAPLFKDEDLVNILESAVPGVFNGLQIAMSEVGLLELPHLMKSMRM